MDCATNTAMTKSKNICEISYEKGRWCGKRA
jgi:hypothetical protein